MTSTIQVHDTVLRSPSTRAPSGRTAAAGPNRQSRNGATPPSQTHAWARKQPPTPPSWEDLLGRR